MADDREGPSIDRVREQLRRDDPPQPDFDPDAGPKPDRITEERERLEDEPDE